jgi:hypothetical protein
MMAQALLNINRAPTIDLKNSITGGIQGGVPGTVDQFRLSKDSFYSSFFSSKRFGFGKSTKSGMVGHTKKGGKNPKSKAS